MAISRVRHPNKLECLRLCRIKESEGFEIKKKIQFVDGFWQAVYEKEWVAK